MSEESEAAGKSIWRRIEKEMEKHDLEFRSLYKNGNDHAKALRDLQLLAAIHSLGGESGFESVSAIANGWSGKDIKPTFIHAALDRLEAAGSIASHARVFAITADGESRLSAANEQALARVTGKDWDDSDPAAWGMPDEQTPEAEEMEVTEILRRTDRATGRFEREAVEKALDSEEEITPELFRILESLLQVVENSPEKYVKIDPFGDYTAHRYAILLLGEFRNTRAHTLLLRFATLPPNLLESVCGEDFIGELARAIGMTAPNKDGLCTVIENRVANMHLRVDLLESLPRMVNAERLDRDATVHYLSHLFHGGLERAPSTLWDCLVFAALSLDSAELLPEIRQAHEDGLFTPPDPIEEFMEEIQEGLAEARADNNPTKLLPLVFPKSNRFDSMTGEGWWSRKQRDHG